MARVKNISAGPRGIWSTSGLVMIDAGKSATVELAPGDHATDYFEIDGGEAGAEPGLSDHTVAELTAIAAAEEIDLGDATKKADIIAAIELAREGRAQA